MNKKDRRKCKLLDIKFGLSEGTTQMLKESVFPRFFRDLKKKEGLKCLKKPER